MALRTEVLIPAGPQHHQKQAAPFDLHAFQYYFSGIWNQRRLFHRTQPEIARATLLLPPNTSSATCPLWFTKCADEPNLRIPVKWAPDSGEVGRRRSEATLVAFYSSEIAHMSQ